MDLNFNSKCHIFLRNRVTRGFVARSMGWLKETSADATSAHDQYAFEADNPYQEQADPFNEALQKRQQGDLPSAILLFEAALQKNADHAQAWQMLGLSLSENEQDPAAITALKYSPL